ncbi:MAG: RNA polymerase sigma factor [Saprospiraceae bacterium]|nr:RNA polymerase sigma factor [Saprospiraceae bacterium]
MSLQTFTNEVLPLKDKLYRFSLRIVHSPQEAEDVVQEIMIKVWDKREEWNNWSSIEAMCMTMTRNLSIDRTRSKHRKLGEIPDGFDVVEDSASPEQATSSKDLMNHIRKIMDLLPEKQKSIIQLRDIEGYTYQEIADLLEIPLSQVKVNVHRARLFLKKEILKSSDYGRK